MSQNTVTQNRRPLRRTRQGLVRYSALIVLILIGLSVQGQKSYSYVAKEYAKGLDPKYERIIGKAVWIDWKDGSAPGWYYKVEHDYGETPPDNIETLNSFLKGTKTVRGWNIEFKELVNIGGDCAFGDWLVIKTNPKATFYFKTYVDTLSLSECETFTIHIRPQYHSPMGVSTIGTIPIDTSARNSFKKAE